MTTINQTSEPSLDECMDEHMAEKARAEQAAREEQEKQQEYDRLHYVADLDNQRHDRVRSELPIMRCIAAHVKMVTKLSVEHGERDATLTIGNVNVMTNLCVEEQRRNLSRFRSEPTGKRRVVVLAGERRSFPERKDGSHDYAQIAQLLVDVAERKITEALAEMQRKRNTSAALELRAEFNLPEYDRVVRQSPIASLPVYVDLSQVSDKVKAMTIADARKLLKALRECGIKLSYNDK